MISRGQIDGSVLKNMFTQIKAVTSPLVVCKVHKRLHNASRDRAKGMRVLLEALNEDGRALKSRTRQFKEASTALKDGLVKTKE